MLLMLCPQLTGHRNAKQKIQYLMKVKFIEICHIKPAPNIKLSNTGERGK
jgi:hypothetical protein